MNLSAGQARESRDVTDAARNCNSTWAHNGFEKIEVSALQIDCKLQINMSCKRSTMSGWMSISVTRSAWKHTAAMARSFGVDPQWKEEKYDSIDDELMIMPMV